MKRGDIVALLKNNYEIAKKLYFFDKFMISLLFFSLGIIIALYE